MTPETTGGTGEIACKVPRQVEEMMTSPSGDRYWAARHSTYGLLLYDRKSTRRTNNQVALFRPQPARVEWFPRHEVSDPKRYKSVGAAEREAMIEGYDGWRRAFAMRPKPAAATSATSTSSQDPPTRRPPSINEEEFFILHKSKKSATRDNKEEANITYEEFVILHDRKKIHYP